MKHTFVREKSIERRGCDYKEVDWYEYSEEEQSAVRQPRRTRTKGTIPKVKQLNDKRSRKYFRWLLNNNFGREDYHVTLTFAKEPSRMGSKKAYDNFMRRLRRLYHKHGITLKYISVFEGRRSSARLHFHVVMSGGVPREEIENLWKLGMVNADRLQPDPADGLNALAAYLTKSVSLADKYERSWNCSTNLKRPDEVADDNSVSRKRMRKVQDAARNDEVTKIVEKLYDGWRVIDYEIGCNPVTGRQYAHFRLLRNKPRTAYKKGKSP